MPKARIRALEQVLRAVVERPEPGALVIACTDPEVLYLAWLLGQLDEESPADRFCVFAEPFTTAERYLDRLETTVRAAVTLPITAADPTIRLQTLLHHLLADLPPGDHRLIVALIPPKIDHPDRFATLINSLLTAAIDPRLRLIVRDDRTAPRAFTTAARSTSDGIYAYCFALPPELHVAAITAVTHDHTRPSDERAAALLQLASLDLGHGRHAHALARCRAIARLTASPPLKTFALALEADVLRHRGDHDAAIAVGLLALQGAIDSDNPPIVQHAALALGELTRDLGRTAEAAACFEIAERAAVFNPEVRTRARDLRDALNHRC